MKTAELKQQIEAFDEQLELNFSTTPIDKLLENRASFIDGLLILLWRECSFESDNFSLNAVGGYGRRELHPYSDVDLCILHELPLNENEKVNMSSFITKLWDLGLNVGQSVRSLQENIDACKRDITIATNLSEIRTITGNKKHAQDVKTLFYSNRLWTDKHFFFSKLQEQSERHVKLSHESFKLEPDLKNGPGTLRDIQTLFWIWKKNLGKSDIATLKDKGYLKAEEYAEIMEAQYFIWRVRWALHNTAGRDQNRLLLEFQSEVAFRLGFGESGNLPIEKMMRQLFRAIKRIREINSMMMLFLEQDFKLNQTSKIEPIDNNFEVVDGLIQVRDEDVFVHRKEMLSMFRHIAHSDIEIKGIAPNTLRLLRQARRRLLGDLQDFEESRKEFVAIFKFSKRMGLAISLMHLHGIFSSYLPQWREIVGQMQFDLFHAYTVDEHIYRVMLNINKIAAGETDERLKFLSGIFHNIDQKESLMLAAIFHDIAKGRGGEHSDLGAIDAQLFCQFHNLKKSHTSLITWLVKNHLLMSITSQRLDIYDPEVIHSFAKTVGTQRRLDALFCLTVADIKATNESLWSDWKGSLLEKLYYSTKRALRDGLENVFNMRQRVKENKEEALSQLLSYKHVNVLQVNTLWKRLPFSFFNVLESDEIAHLSNLIIEADLGEELVAIKNNINDGCSSIYVYVKNKNGIFSALFGALTSLNITVKDAQIAQSRDGYVFEVLRVLDFDNKPIQSENRISVVRKKLIEALSKSENNINLSMPRKLGSFENNPQIEYLNSRKKNRTLISITALDNPMFMEKICRSFHELKINIHSAKISTVGESVDNVFLVSNSLDTAMSITERTQLENSLLSFLK